MKYNLSMLKNKQIQFDIVLNKKNVSFSKNVKNIKQTKEIIKFEFEDSNLEIQKETFNHMLLKYDEEKELLFLIYDEQKKYVSGFVGFTMFDTYGFPIEMTEEIFSEKGMHVDMDGFYILRKLQKQMSNNTFKNKNAFL